MRSSQTLLLTLLLATFATASTAQDAELLSVEFLTRPGELRAVFQGTSPTLRLDTERPLEDKAVVTVQGLCRRGQTDGELCPEGPAAALQKAYRFERDLPVRQLNLVDLGTGTVQLIWRLRTPGVEIDVQQEGDRFVVLLRGERDREKRAQAASGGLPSSTPSQDPRSRRPSPARSERTEPSPPRGPARSDRRRSLPVPSAKADTILSEPDPAFLPQNREYRIGAGDRVKVVVHNDERLTRESLEVDATGYVDLPLIGSLPVAGHTASEVEAELERLLGEKYLKDPDVTILVDEYNSQWVNVMGAVGSAGRIALKGNTTLMDILSEVEGASEDASGLIVVHRRGETEPLRIRLDELLAGAEGTNILLGHGDTVNVEAKKPFYVSGEVKSPGKYNVEPGMTILDALAAAGGITPYAKEKEVIILRTVDGERQRLVANPKAIEKGKERNIEVQSGDHIKVPGSYF